jgi:hypothetical protein
MTSFDFEGAIVFPKVDRVRNACYAAFVDLGVLAAACEADETHQFGRLGPRDGELKVCIFLPIPEEQRELR